MRKQKKPTGYWTKENCLLEASKYSRKSEFRLTAKSAYLIASQHGWLEEITAHMEDSIKPRGYWTKERCTSVASQYTSVSKFISENQGAYKNSRKNGWFEEITSHMRTSSF